MVLVSMAPLKAGTRASSTPPCPTVTTPLSDSQCGQVQVLPLCVQLLVSPHLGCMGKPKISTAIRRRAPFCGIDRLRVTIAILARYQETKGCRAFAEFYENWSRLFFIFCFLRCFHFLTPWREQTRVLDRVPSVWPENNRVVLTLEKSVSSSLLSECSCSIWLRVAKRTL
ncbi:hypothetical protein AVEN_185288-1 [Araneus ventricosus]|uniref:Uncharacterized protein n=1 Tax=Araneus ventricosus TaxID=182803 RepID=A0A4Y2KV23_ARAVE|nr:hypothetical protein AVEN_185288-1 [Araneus ventricosus]